jgi:hypothetical protein
MTRLRPPSDVAVTEEGDAVYAAHLPDGPIAVLEGTAALIWDEACSGERETIADRVAEATGAAADEIRSDVESFVDQLVAQGLLT